MASAFACGLKCMLKRAFIIVICILATMPVLLTIFYSFKSPALIQTYIDIVIAPLGKNSISIKVFPTFASLLQYKSILVDDLAYIWYYANSAIYGLSIAFGQAVVGVLAAYALSCFRFKGRNVLSFIFISVMILPFQVTMAPTYFVLEKVKLIDTPYAIILPGIFLPFCTFMYRQHFLGISKELLDASIVDGANSFNILIRILIPMSKSLICTSIVLSFIDAWNLVEQPLIFLTSRARFPLSLVLITESNWNAIFAESTLFLSLPLLLILFYYDDILDGIQMCDLK